MKMSLVIDKKFDASLLNRTYKPGHKITNKGCVTELKLQITGFKLENYEKCTKFSLKSEETGIEFNDFKIQQLTPLNPDVPNDDKFLLTIVNYNVNFEKR